ncbi:glycosyltransferase family 9 protein [soil metagenome]
MSPSKTSSSPGPKVLFISPNRIGDSVIASGIVREIGRRWPGARITQVTGGPTEPFYRSAPGVERIIAMEKTKWAGHWFKLWGGLIGSKWDVVIDTRASITGWLVRAGEHHIYSRKMETGLSKVEIASALVGSKTPLAPELFIDDRARAEAASILEPQLSGGAGPGRIMALAPIANQPGKSWPADRWGLLVERLMAEPRFDGWRFMMVGGPGDHEPAAPALAAAGDRGIDFVGRGDILCSAAAITRAALFAGNDSGLMHTAAAAGIPTLGLFGPTEWWLYAPWGPKTRTVASNEVRGEYAPIENLSVDHVFDAVIALHDDFIGTPASPASVP